MRLPQLIEGRFVRRANRFRVTLDVGGVEVDAHLPNSGRLTELLTPGRPCWLRPADASHRKTDFDLKLVEHAGVLVSVDARLPNALFEEALREERLAPFQPCAGFDREVFLADSRIDFRLGTPDGPFWVETKSVTLVQDGVALFPDAPTARGRRHVEALAGVAGEGSRSAAVFIVQRSDARCFAPFDAADRPFGEALRSATTGGVAVYAWTCSVSQEAIAIAGRIPVDLS